MNANENLVRRSYQICTKCIMDTSDLDIRFDEHGVCNHCYRAAERARNEIFNDAAGQVRLERLLERMKKDGKGRNYDCVVGVTGGVDSTYVAYKCKELGLRPLAVHFDNGWNSELAVHNMEKVLSFLGIDLYTQVVDWEEFRDIQLSFFKASVTNVELPTDHGAIGTLFKVSADRSIRYIVTGSNIATESVLPDGWSYDHRDFKHLKAIHKKYGTKKISSLPYYTAFDFAYYMAVKRLKIVKLLNFLPFNRKEAETLLRTKMGWVDYGGKHFESVFTRFFQGYYLPKKFGIDKRRVHLACLVYSGQMTREQALVEIEQTVYPPALQREDIEFVMKKFGWSEADFNAVMTAPPRSHFEFPMTKIFTQDTFGLVKLAKRLALAS